MVTNDKCEKCGAAKSDNAYHDWRGSTIFNCFTVVDRWGVVQQSSMCLRLQVAKNEKDIKDLKQSMSTLIAK